MTFLFILLAANVSKSQSRTNQLFRLELPEYVQQGFLEEYSYLISSSLDSNLSMLDVTKVYDEFAERFHISEENLELLFNDLGTEADYFVKFSDYQNALRKSGISEMRFTVKDIVQEDTISTIIVNRQILGFDESRTHKRIVDNTSLVFRAYTKVNPVKAVEYFELLGIYDFIDQDRDLVFDGLDKCPHTKYGKPVTSFGCTDEDGDGYYPDIAGQEKSNRFDRFDNDGCYPDDQVEACDQDQDGVPDKQDQCKGTPYDHRDKVNAHGCIDQDEDGFFPFIDQASGKFDENDQDPCLPKYDTDHCDLDRDGFQNEQDSCSNTIGTSSLGCPQVFSFLDKRVLHSENTIMAIATIIPGKRWVSGSEKGEIVLFTVNPSSNRLRRLARKKITGKLTGIRVLKEGQIEVAYSKNQRENKLDKMVLSFDSEANRLERVEADDTGYSRNASFYEQAEVSFYDPKQNHVRLVPSSAIEQLQLSTNQNYLFGKLEGEILLLKRSSHPEAVPFVRILVKDVDIGRNRDAATSKLYVDDDTDLLFIGNDIGQIMTFSLQDLIQ